MKRDIVDREDLIKIVDVFYDKIKADHQIGYLFTEVAEVNWEKHLPKMYDFWENILFHTAKYEGNPMLKHKELHQKSTMSTVHFNRWNKLFTETVDSLFKGLKAEEIKNRAMNISSTIMYKTIY